MSVKTEINRITANVASSYTAIKDRGMEVAVEENSDNLPGAIDSAFDDVDALLDDINGVVV